MTRTERRTARRVAYSPHFSKLKLNIMASKVCAGCKEKKDLSEFYRSPATIDKVRAKCKKCINDIDNDRRIAKRNYNKEFGIF